MPKEIYPSSYQCDCGHQSHFAERTIREMKAMSLKRKTKQYLVDSEPEEHQIVFYQGSMIDIICPKQGKRKELKEKRKMKCLTAKLRNSRGASIEAITFKK